MRWESIETLSTYQPIWVIKYSLYQRLVDDRQEWCQADDEGAVKFTSCHGYYTNFDDAMKVLRHFPKPNTYQIEKVYKRELK